MKKLKFDVLDCSLTNLSSDELITVSGGGWVSDVAYAAGFVVGYFAHAVINAAELVAGVDLT